MFLLWPAALAQPAPTLKAEKPLPRAEAESRLLEAFDEGNPIPPLRVAPKDRQSLLWLRQAAEGTARKNPFPKGSKAHGEAQALLDLLQATPETWEARLKRLPLALTGSHLALWQWGKTQVKSGRMGPALRVIWEDRLLHGEAPTLKGLALRHSLCWALSDLDESRFATLKARHGAEGGAIFPEFQGLFGWIGGSSKVFRFWKLPQLLYADLRLDQLGGARVWICPDDKDLPQIPPGTAWIVPSMEGLTGATDPSLSPRDQAEAEALSSRLQAAHLQAWFAPQRRDWEAAGLAYFPILIELDEAHRITKIRMGDAAPTAP